jgi:hypothetical protein
VRVNAIDSSLKSWTPGMLRTDEDWCSSWQNLADSNSTFLHLFVLFRPWRDWIMSTHIGEGHLFCSVHQFKC